MTRNEDTESGTSPQSSRPESAKPSAPSLADQLGMTKEEFDVFAKENGIVELAPGIYSQTVIHEEDGE